MSEKIASFQKTKPQQRQAEEGWAKEDKTYARHKANNNYAETNSAHRELNAGHHSAAISILTSYSRDSWMLDTTVGQSLF